MIRNKFLYLILFFLVIGFIRNLFIIDSQKNTVENNNSNTDSQKNTVEDTNDILEKQIEELQNQIKILQKDKKNLIKNFDRIYKFYQECKEIQIDKLGEKIKDYDFADILNKLKDLEDANAQISDFLDGKIEFKDKKNYDYAEISKSLDDFLGKI